MFRVGDTIKLTKGPLGPKDAHHNHLVKVEALTGRLSGDITVSACLTCKVGIRRSLPADWFTLHIPNILT